MDPHPIPFDEFQHISGIAPASRRGRAERWTVAAVRAISFLALWLAVLTAACVVLRHALPLVPALPSVAAFQLPASLQSLLKSAIPLIAIGTSYICLILTVPRSPGQRLVGFLMGLAFVLWGTEQYLKDRELVSFIDDCVVFLFVIDLSLVIRQNFRECAGERRLRMARLPVVKTLDTFSFGAQPALDEGLVRTLARGDYIDRRENVLIVGNPGTGKTHLAVALGHAACMQGREVLFTTASALVADLIDAQGSGRLGRLHRRLDRLDLLIIDELGYVRFSELGAQLLFEVLRTGYERRSHVIATTVPLEKWGDIFGNETVAKSAADRLADRGHFLKTTGDPYWKPGRNVVAGARFRAV